MKRYIINPFFVFASSMALAFLLYVLQWSELYGFRSGTLEIFIVLILLASLGMSVACQKILLKHEAGPHQSLDISMQRFMIIMCVLWLVFFYEVIDFGGVPLLMTLAGEDFNYQDFGVSKLHVLFVPYYCAFSIICFYRMMISKNKLYLIAILSSMSFSLLAMSRGTLMINCIGFAFVYLYLTRNTWRAMLSVMVLGVCFILAFGYLGDKRMMSSGYQSQTAIYDVGRADREVFNSHVPSGFFWVYLYTSSSFANLENQVQHENTNTSGLYELVRTSILSDYVAKRMPESDDEYSVELITPELIVSTAFGLPIVIMGYTGILIVFAWYCLLCWGALSLVRQAYFIPLSAVLCSMSSLMLFDNMLVFGSFFTQILLVLLLPYSSESRYRFI